MKEDNADFIDVAQLRVGLFVELDVGWMAHPFPTGSFKITAQKQIDTIRSLGLKRVRFVPSKSDPDSATSSQAEPANPAAQRAQEQQAQRLLEAERAQQLRRQRSEMLGAQQRSLVECERRFGETTKQYRKTLEQLSSNPKVAAQQCQTMVSGIVGDMLVEGESAIRLLSEAAGDKASMHAVNVSIVALLLGKAMGLDQGALVELGVACFLHDIGKVNLPERVRWQEDNFSTAEYKLYQDHVQQSVAVARSMALSTTAIDAIAQHHELADGSGFPSRLPSDRMTVAARILALVNRYDNLCNPSKPASALTPHEALAMIFAQLKTRFDSAALSAFIRMMGVYPPGSVVQLIDDRYAMVVSVNSSRPLKPRVIVHEPGVPKYEALILDLELAPSISIRRSVRPSKLPGSTMDYLSPRPRVNYYFESVSDAAMAEAA